MNLGGFGGLDSIMKKLISVLMSLIVVCILIVSCGADVMDSLFVDVYSFNEESKTLVKSGTGEVIEAPFIAVESKKGVYKLVSKRQSGESFSFEEIKAENFLIVTAGGVLSIDAPNAVVDHFGKSNSVVVKSIASDSYHCNAEVSESLSVGAGHVVLNIAVPNVEIKATNDISIEIVENVEVEQIKIEESESSNPNLEIKITGIGEAKKIEVNTPVVIDTKAEKVEIKKAVEVEFSDSAKVGDVAVSVEKSDVENLVIRIGDAAEIQGISAPEEIKTDIQEKVVDSSGERKEVHNHTLSKESIEIEGKWYEKTFCTDSGCDYQFKIEIETPSFEDIFFQKYPNAVCRIGDVGYDYPFNYTLKNKGYTNSAFSAAKDGDTIVMLKDFDLLTDIDSSASDRSNDKTNNTKVTIDLNGYAVKYKSQIQLTQGDYTFTDTSDTKLGRVDSTVSLYGLQDEQHIVRCSIEDGSFKKVQTAGDKGAKYLTVSGGHIDYCEVQETEYNADAVLKINGGTFDYIGISKNYSGTVGQHIQFGDGRTLSAEITDMNVKLNVYGSNFMASAYMLFTVESEQ